MCVMTKIKIKIVLERLKIVQKLTSYWLI